MRVLVGGDAVASAAVAEGRVDERDVRQRPERAVRVVLRQRPRPGRAARSPDRREREIRVVVLGGDAARQSPVEDRLPLVAGGVQRRRVVLAPARLRRPLVVAVRPRRGQHRAEEAVVDRELLRRRVDELDLALVVVGQGELVVAAALGQEPVAQLRPPRLPAVPRIRMAAALPLGLERRGVARPNAPARRAVDERLLLIPVRSLEPAEVVVERAVLHHHDDDVVDRHVAPRGQRPGLALRGLGDHGAARQPAQAGEAGDRRGAGEELAAAEGLLVHAKPQRPRRANLAARNKALHWPGAGRGGRVAEGTRLLSEYGAESPIAGSNPALSA